MKIEKDNEEIFNELIELLDKIAKNENFTEEKTIEFKKRFTTVAPEKVNGGIENEKRP